MTNTPNDGVDYTSDLAEQNSSSDKEQNPSAHREDHRFKEGQLIRMIRVRFPGNARSFSFLTGKTEWRHGDKVVALSDRGMAVGFINSFSYEVPFHPEMLPLRTIARHAHNDDLVLEQETFRLEKKYWEACQKQIDRHQLDMQLTHVETTQFGKKAVFYFIAPSRVDFRALVSDLVAELKMRIELRQISVRDRAAAVGGLGPCGRELCCSSFLAKYGNVGIKYAKNQDLSLNSSKVNGVCGQLKCCLTYEDDVYTEKRKKLPRENAIIRTLDGVVGKVLNLHVIQETFDLLSDQGVVRRYTAEEWDAQASTEGIAFPKVFEQGLSFETQKIIGLEERKKLKTKLKDEEISGYPEASKIYADLVFEKLFGAKSLDWSLPELQDNSLTQKVLKPEDEEEISYTQSIEEDIDIEELGESDERNEDDEENFEFSDSSAHSSQNPRQTNQVEKNKREQNSLNSPRGNQHSSKQSRSESPKQHPSSDTRRHPSHKRAHHSPTYRPKGRS
jgi:cell fate regulator YaaT (PSP1 superfamily)